MYQADLGRFFNPDRFSEKYYPLSPYQYTANNPINLVDINGDSIAVQFYDELGNRLRNIPEQVQKLFNEEFGIKVGLNSKTGMLFFDGRVDSELSQSSEATNFLIDALTDDNSLEKGAFKHGRIVFGHNLKNDAGQQVEGGNNFTITSYIDLADFESDGSLKGYEYNNVDIRACNLGRVFEHEYIGHNFRTNRLKDNVGRGFKTGETVDLVNRFRRQRGLPERLNYGGEAIPYSIYGNTSDYPSNKEMMKSIKRQHQSGVVPHQYIRKK